MEIRPGDVMLAALRQADYEVKLRPVVALCMLPGRFKDVLVCGISSQIHQHVSGWDELISPEQDGFEETGLKAASIVRLGHMETLNQRNIRGAIGRLSVDTHQRLITRLIAHLETFK